MAVVAAMSRTLAYAQCWDQKTGGDFAIVHIYQDPKEPGFVFIHRGEKDGDHATIKLPEETWKLAVKRWQEGQRG